MYLHWHLLPKLLIYFFAVPCRSNRQTDNVETAAGSKCLDELLFIVRLLLCYRMFLQKLFVSVIGYPWILVECSVPGIEHSAHPWVTLLSYHTVPHTRVRNLHLQVPYRRFNGMCVLLNSTVTSTVCFMYRTVQLLIRASSKTSKFIMFCSTVMII